MILHPLPPALQLQLQSHPQFVAAKSLIPVPPKIIYNSSYVGLHVTVSDFFEKFAETFLYHEKGTGWSAEKIIVINGEKMEDILKKI